MKNKTRMTLHAVFGVLLGPFALTGVYWLYGWFFDGIRATTVEHGSLAFLATVAWAVSIGFIEGAYAERIEREQARASARAEKTADAIQEILKHNHVLGMMQNELQGMEEE